MYQEVGWIRVQDGMMARRSMAYLIVRRVDSWGQCESGI